MNKTLLLVEDESIIAMSNKSSLEKYGYTVIPVNSGEKAISEVESRTDIDLILMDINLGDGIDGTETAEIILKKHNIPVVFLSSHTEQEIVKKTEGITSYGYVVKYSGMTILDTSIKMAFKLFEANKKIEEEKEHLNITLNSIGDAVIATDMNGNITRMNPIAESMTGWKISEALGKPIGEVFNIINATSRKAVVNPIAEVIKNGIVVGLANHTILISKDGTEYQIADSAAPIKNSFNKIIGMVLVFHDVTHEYKMREVIEKTETKYSSLFNSMVEGFALHEMTYDENGVANGYRFLDVNPAFERFTKLSKNEIIGKNVYEVFPGTEQIWIDRYGSVAATGTSVEFEHLSSELGKYFHVSAFSPQKGQFASVFYDVTDSKISRDNLIEASTKDYLTKVYNRRYIFDRMQHLSDEYRRTGKIFSVAIIDIDHFKAINDQYGHQAGDFILAKLAETIKNNLRAYDLVGRYGGEEFIFIFPEARKQNIVSKMNSMLNIIKDTVFKFNDQEIKITFSCGISSSDEVHGIFSVDKIIEISDGRLYTAKDSGRSNICCGE